MSSCCVQVSQQALLERIAKATEQLQLQMRRVLSTQVAVSAEVLHNGTAMHHLQKQATNSAVLLTSMACKGLSIGHIASVAPSLSAATAPPAKSVAGKRRQQAEEKASRKQRDQDEAEAVGRASIVERTEVPWQRWHGVHHSIASEYCILLSGIVVFIFYGVKKEYY